MNSPSGTGSSADHGNSRTSAARADPAAIGARPRGDPLRLRGRINAEHQRGYGVPGREVLDDGDARLIAMRSKPFYVGGTTPAAVLNAHHSKFLQPPPWRNRSHANPRR